jgi:hypothetical protein
MLEAFNLNPAATSAMLSGARYGGWRGVLAGGAMLHCYMGLPPSEHKGDLDAFIAAEEVAAWEHLLKGAGYRISRVIRTAGEGGSTGYVPAGEQEEGEEAAEVSTVEQSGGGGDQADGEAYLALGTQAGSGSKDPAEEAEEQDLEDYSALGKSYAKVGAGKGYAYIDRGISQVGAPPSWRPHGPGAACRAASPDSHANAIAPSPSPMQRADRVPARLPLVAGARLHPPLHRTRRPAGGLQGAGEHAPQLRSERCCHLVGWQAAQDPAPKAHRQASGWVRARGGGRRLRLLAAPWRAPPDPAPCRCEAFFMTEGTSNEANRAKKYRAKGFTIVKRPWWC